MWIKALDILHDRLRLKGLDYASVVGICGSGQQHGSVFWKRGSLATLKNLDPGRFLHEQLSLCFSLKESPIWMDSSTTKQCRELEQHVGGEMKLAELTGSRAYERFTGNQIAKIVQTKPEVYQQTERISMVSSFLTSLFVADYAPIEMSDGSGMNLFDIHQKRWSPECLRYCGGGGEGDGEVLAKKLGENLVPPGTIVGNIDRYFVERYGYNEECHIVGFTGDNPCSLAGMCLGPNDVAVSLGTSDTSFISLTSPRASLDGHVFVNPINVEHYMGLICFKNGSLTRERIRNTNAEGDWELFNQLLDSTPRGNFGNVGFYFDLKEIFPVVAGDFRFNRFDGEVSNFANEVEIRACVEGQFLRLRIHAENLGFKVNASTRILATGGASTNLSVIKVLADVFNSPVFIYKMPNSACLGGALLAKYAGEKDTAGSFYDMALKLNANYKLMAKPSADAAEVYDALAERYRRLEALVAQKQQP